MPPGAGAASISATMPSAKRPVRRGQFGAVAVAPADEDLVEHAAPPPVDRLDVETVPLSEVADAWTHGGDRRTVLLP
ncbi:hypothetical protein [Actinomadura litoris]|uniref:hypothetical protein n=1 Tax=Actinomadura litoris TaxID=2678616 RepID=UPI001FA7D692|nr:hypothetical protein [Actinomadura litoris]